LALPKVDAAGVASLGAWDFRPLLRKVRSPALVIDGAASNVPLDDVRAWATALTNGRLLLVPDAGHMNWLDQPDAVIHALDTFFRGNWPRFARR
jgi:pimeloyl-ACP methyl ester carboxylesterase